MEYRSVDHENRIAEKPALWAKQDAFKALQTLIEGALESDVPINTNMAVQDGPTALCSETDPELFFPPQGGEVRAAKRICASCVLRPNCLAASIVGSEAPESDGVWGGMSAHERRTIVRSAKPLINAYVERFNIPSNIARYTEPEE